MGILRRCAEPDCEVLTVAEFCTEHEPAVAEREWARGRPFPEQARRALPPTRSRRPLLPRALRSHARLVLAALVASGTAAVVAGLAFANSGATPIGTGVVVINTNLAYQGGQGAGTGMVLTSSGEVLTNNHVIRGATTIKIVVPGTRHSYKARVLGYDVSRDVAVLKAVGASDLKTVSLTNSAKVKVGQTVRAVGNAGGTGSLTRVSGKVTGVKRAITVSDDQGGREHLTGLIKTNASLEPGDSGGPLLNGAGKVIGMNTAASSGFSFQRVSSTAGFSIPINRAITITKRIESGKGTARIHVGGTAFLGIETVPYGYSASGAMVRAVFRGSPADSAGLAFGDLITSFAGHSISSPTELTSIVTRQKPGAHISLRYMDRFGQTHTATVTLASGPPQ